MNERLQLTLSVTIGKTVHAIPGGAVRKLSLAMTSYGVSGSVSFVMHNDSTRGGQHEDTLLPDFLKPDLGSVKLEIAAAHWDTSATGARPTIVVSGLIQETSLSESEYVRQLNRTSVLVRTYTLRFADPVHVLWRQHFPCDLLVGKAMTDVLEAHKGKEVTLSSDWDAVTLVRPQLFFDLAPERGASFHDFMLWFISTYQGVLTLDHKQGTYRISQAKPAAGSAGILSRDDVETLTNRFPEQPRHSARVLNSNTESAAKRIVDNAQAADSVFRDILLRTAVADEVDARVTLETKRSVLRKRELTVEFRRFPTVPVVPGSLVDISSRGDFSTDRIAASEPWRVFGLTLDAQALSTEPEKDHEQQTTGFALTIKAELEAQSDDSSRLPAFRAPQFPGHLEGKVVSELGETADITYQSYQDKTTQLSFYKVKIPLFAAQLIDAPFEPQEGSGMFYIPIYKNARVLVALDFQHSRIARLLDWRPGAETPLAGQGQQLLLGKSAQSNTSVQHDYQADKPVFRILRTNAKDTALIHIEEGVMKFVVEEGAGS